MPLKPSTVAGTDTFLTWRNAFNTLRNVAVGYVVSASAPGVNDDITDYDNGTIWVHTTPNPNVSYILVDNTNAAAVWVELGSTPGALINTGAVPLIANWNAGAYNITAQQFISTQTTGTSPFTVASTTVVTNLNADTVDGSHASALLARANHTGTQLMSTISDAGALATLSAVDNTKLADMAQWTIKMRAASGTGDPSDTKISGLTEATSVGSGDFLMMELSTGELRKLSATKVGLTNDQTVKLASFTAVAGYRYIIDTDTGAGSPADVIVTLPTSPAYGDTVEVFHVGVGDVATPSANEALYINPGASWKIMTGANDEDLRIDKIGAAVRLMYTNSTYGWRVSVL